MKRKYTKPKFTVSDSYLDVLLTSDYGQDNVEGWIWDDMFGGES